ncbi:transposase [Janthinobacterium sp. SUN211]|uniref:transposase n=1 Tax=Janthinobacterium sp. SUN211 TaxID=3014786 RepID=UPI0027130A05|nr:transposase [Janthinobacterium sp. SUN211]MDO8048376.1 transposase [Janthinobacterium sp. SUN211]
MTRPLRLEFAGALYHVTSRGDRHKEIYRDDTDRIAWLRVLGLVCQRHHFIVHDFCQMSNHYHLLIETAEANLSQGMRQLNGVYSQHFNRLHRLVGHLFQRTRQGYFSAERKLSTGADPQYCPQSHPGAHGVLARCLALEQPSLLHPRGGASLLARNGLTPAAVRCQAQ